MRVLLAVFYDLWNFFFGWWFKVGKKPEVKEESIVTPPAEPAFKKREARNVLVGKTFFIKASQSRVLAKPYLAFDNVLDILPYGREVTAFASSGQYISIYFNDRAGYIHQSEITKHKTELFPQLVDKTIYLAGNDETEKIRLIINDEFSAAELFLPLQAVEFIMYYLRLENITINWGKDRPRPAGSWGKLLKGRIGVKISLEPKTGAVLECVNASGDGFVAIVKAVSVDKTITIAGVGRLVDGEYKEEKFTKDEWQKLQPVFLQFS